MRVHSGVSRAIGWAREGRMSTESTRPCRGLRPSVSLSDLADQNPILT